MLSHFHISNAAKVEIERLRLLHGEGDVVPTIGFVLSVRGDTAAEKKILDATKTGNLSEVISAVDPIPSSTQSKELSIGFANRASIPKEDVLIIGGVEIAIDSIWHQRFHEKTLDYGKRGFALKETGGVGR